MSHLHFTLLILSSSKAYNMKCPLSVHHRQYFIIKKNKSYVSTQNYILSRDDDNVLEQKKHVGQVFTKKTYWGCECRRKIHNFSLLTISIIIMDVVIRKKKYAQIQMATDIFSTNGHNHDDDPLSTMKIHLFSLLVFSSLLFGLLCGRLFLTGIGHCIYLCCWYSF